MLETNFVHRYTEQPISWLMLLGGVIYYWGIFGFCVMYYFLKPTYTPWVALSDNVYLALGALYMIFEALNYRCH